jgi:hypothetical protein
MVLFVGVQGPGEGTDNVFLQHPPEYHLRH